MRDQHTHCPCNGVLLCGTCHRWAHSRPTAARHAGFIVSRGVGEPGRVEVDTWYGRLLLLCDGDIEFVVREEQSGPLI